MRTTLPLLVFASAAPLRLSTCSALSEGPPEAASEVAAEAAPAGAMGTLVARQTRAACLPSDRDHGDVDPRKAMPLGALAERGVGGCVFRAYRAQGALWERSEPVWVAEGEALPEPRFAGRDGGLGIEFETARAPGRPPGVWVRKVQTGSPAVGWLFPGDRIVAVDGHEVLDATRWEFADLGMGPVGSTVTVEVVGADGLVRAVPIVRARIE